MATFYDPQSSYTLQSANDPITIAVAFGNGQTGTYQIFKGTDQIGNNHAGNAGTAANCNGSVVKVIATIPNLVAQTKWTNVLVTITEGANSTPLNFENELPDGSDMAVYTITLNFAK